MDIPSIAAILNSAIDMAKHIKNSDNSLEKAERDLRFAGLIGELTEAKLEMTNIQQQLLEKDKQIRDLHEQIDINEKLRYEPPYYWLVESGNKDGPFCQVCYDKDNKLMRLHEDKIKTRRGLWSCKVCNNFYTDSLYIEPDLPVEQANWRVI